MGARRVILGLVGLGLLAGCGQGARERGDLAIDPAQRVTPLPEGAPPPPAKTYVERLADVPSDATEQETLEALLYDSCGGCHGSDYDQSREGAGMYYVDDIDRLIEAGMIIPGDAAESKLVLRMARGEMPPVGAGLPPAPQELLERLSDFVQSLPRSPIQEH